MLQTVFIVGNKMEFKIQIVLARRQEVCIKGVYHISPKKYKIDSAIILLERERKRFTIEFL